MIYIDKYAYISMLKTIDPMLKLTASLLTLGICLWANSLTVSIIVIFTLGWTTVKKGRIPLYFYIKMMLSPMVFLLIGLLTIVVNISKTHQDFILYFEVFKYFIGITEKSVSFAVLLFFKALASVSCLYFLSLSTPIVELLTALQRLKLPKLFVELMGLIYRFIFVILETANTIYTSQTSRLGYSNTRAAYRSLSGLISSLFILSYKRFENLYTALEARGYEGELNVIHQKFDIVIHRYIVVILFEILLITTALVIHRWVGGIW